MYVYTFVYDSNKINKYSMFDIVCMFFCGLVFWKYIFFTKYKLVTL